MMKEKIVIAFNGHKADIAEKSQKDQQGGPLRFSDEFKKYFSKDKNVILKPIVFSYNDTDATLKIHKIKGIEFAEIVSNKTLFHELHTGVVAKKLLPKVLHDYIAIVAAYFETHGVTIVFLNGFSISNWILMYVARQLNIPVVMQHAGIFLEDITAGGKKPVPAVKRLFTGLEKDTIDMVDHHVFLNNFSKKRFEELYKNAAGMKTSVIPIPINTPATVKTRTVKNNVSIGMVARWDSIKNFSAVLRLAQAMPKHWTIHCVVRIPETGSEFAKTFKENVVIESPRPIKEIYQFFKKMDVVIFPSHFETFGSVVAESMAVGTPVVVSENTGVSELFKKYKLNDHLIAPSISGEAFVATIQHVIDFQKKNEAHYQAFRAGLKKDFSPETVFQSYEKLFVKYSKR